MPLVRFIYPPDIRLWGDAPVSVADVQARVLTEMRRATPVTEDDLTALTKPALVDLADQVGADVPKRDAKGHFVKAIAEAEAE